MSASIDNDVRVELMSAVNSDQPISKGSLRGREVQKLDSKAMRELYEEFKFYSGQGPGIAMLLGGAIALAMTLEPQNLITTTTMIVGIGAFVISTALWFNARIQRGRLYDQHNIKNEESDFGAIVIYAEKHPKERKTVQEWIKAYRELQNNFVEAGGTLALI